jgi:hypothetical protein
MNRKSSLTFATEQAEPLALLYQENTSEGIAEQFRAQEELLPAWQRTTPAAARR